MNSSLELLYLIIFSGILAVGYSYLLSGQILSASAGNEKMKEIAGAIQIGAKAYLNRQYKTIAIVGLIVLIIVTYFFVKRYKSFQTRAPKKSYKKIFNQIIFMMTQ